MTEDRTAPSTPSPVYDEQYYRSHLSDEGYLEYGRTDHWMNFFGRIAEEIDKRLKPTTVLDAGCAIGLLVEKLRERDVDAEGFDFSEYAVSQAHESISDHIRVGTLTEPIEGTYDLITCIEVIEHLPSKDASLAIKHLAAATDRLLLSTTPYDYDEPTHLNVQPPEYWAELLAAEGFVRDLDFDASFLTPWAALFRRADDPLPAVVRGYERRMWRLIEERNELRDAANRRAIDQTELEACREAAQQLRDDLRLAIDTATAAEATKGQEMGRRIRLEHELAAAKEREQEFVDLVARIDSETAQARRAHAEITSSLTYRVLRRVVRPLRRLRNRS